MTKKKAAGFTMVELVIVMVVSEGCHRSRDLWPQVLNHQHRDPNYGSVVSNLVASHRSYPGPNFYRDLIA